MGMVLYEQAAQLCCQLFRSLRKSVPLLYKLCCDSLQMGLFSTEQQCSFDVTPPPAAQLRYEFALPPTSFKSCSAKVQHQPATQRQHKRVTPHAVRQDLVKQSAAKRHVRNQLTLFQILSTKLILPLDGSNLDSMGEQAVAVDPPINLE